MQRKKIKYCILVFVMLFLETLFLRTAPAQAQAISGWQDTGLEADSLNCIDPTEPNTLISFSNNYNNNSFTTTTAYSYNWVSKKSTKTELTVTPLPENCGIGGWFFGSKQGQVVRFKSRNPTTEILAHKPTVIAQDGSLNIYSLEFVQENLSAEGLVTGNARLWYSPDVGATWLERKNLPQSKAKNAYGLFANLTAATSDARVLYLTTIDDYDQDKRSVTYSIYRSTDSGQSWGKQATRETKENGNIRLLGLLGQSVPTNMVLVVPRVDLGIDRPYEGFGMIEISTDGGQTFQKVGNGVFAGNCEVGLSSFKTGYSGGGIIRFGRTSLNHDNLLDISYNGGSTWEALPVPLPVEKRTGLCNEFYKLPTNELQYGSSPGTLFLYTDNTTNQPQRNLYYTPNNGQNWTLLGNAPDSLLITPYAPTTLVGLFEKKIYTLTLPNVDKNQILPALPNNAPGSTFFEATKHNLSGIFKEYWEKHGGLAQFGYPKTEPFREVNPADGKVYLVQYFERNRFEYHPELAGTDYEVLLGLLGNQLTEEYRATKNGAFNYFADAKYPGGLYFPQTGHNLRNSFKSYWEQNGGLAIYGYPISEEFEEVNPDDGKTYIVQYFERNRFEYHPENKGTKYEVLLGLLGNSLLKQKGWT